MSEREPLLLLGYPVLRDPLCDIALAPHASLRQFGDGLGEARRAGELVGALAADAEHLADLRGADEFHPGEVLHLTTSSVKRYSPLDAVKGGTVKNRYEAVITLTVSYKAAEGDEVRQLGYIEDALLTRRLGLPSAPTIKHLESSDEIDCMEVDV